MVCSLERPRRAFFASLCARPLFVQVVDYTTVDHIPLHRLQKDSFTKPSLKLYLKKHGLKVSGGKQLLFERVLRHRSKMDFETL